MSSFVSLIRTLVFYVALAAWTGCWTIMMILVIRFFRSESVIAIL